MTIKYRCTNKIIINKWINGWSEFNFLIHLIYNPYKILMDYKQINEPLSIHPLVI